MKTKYLHIIKIFLLIVFVSSSCSRRSSEFENNTDKNIELYYQNFSQNHLNEPETLILMHNRKGIRIEYSITTQELSLWISPQAGKSLDYRDRNFSNRDDHTSIFDEIKFQGLEKIKFDSCKYSPFHSILYYKDQIMHIATIYDKPLVLVWFEKAQVVDFKTYKGDRIIENTSISFGANHYDRGLLFEFAATMGNGTGRFSHQLETDLRRSTYARANLSGGQSLVIGGELKNEEVLNMVRKYADRSIEINLAMTKDKVKKATENGRVLLRSNDQFQKILDMNKDVLLSMQDMSGAMRTSPQYIYYLLWNRDQAYTSSYMAYSGWADPLRLTTWFLLTNPNRSLNYEPKGRFFGQITGSPITKWEEDAAFYVIWAAYTYWTQTGNSIYISRQYLQLIEEAVAWLEKYCFDIDEQLYGRYHYSETPLTGSYGDGWDNANGRPNPVQIATEYNGDTITRSYDLYINNLMISTYWMLAAIKEGIKANDYIIKAQTLEDNVAEQFYPTRGLPLSGKLKNSKDEFTSIGPFGLDTTDYLLANSLPPFSFNYTKQEISNKLKLIEVLDNNNLQLMSYYSLLQSIDNEFVDENIVIDRLENMLVQIERPGKYLPMPNTIMESKGVKDGHPFRDIRPVNRSIASCYATVTGLGVRRMPFGIAVRSTSYISKIEKYQYWGSSINFNWTGQGDISGILLNDKELKYTYQIPVKELHNGENSVDIQMDVKVDKVPVLVSSTVFLNEVTKNNNNITFDIIAVGKNIIVFKNIDPDKVFVKDGYGSEITVSIDEWDEYTVVEYYGKGIFQVIVEE